VQSTGRQPVLDGADAQTKVTKLPPRYDAVLPPRQPPNLSRLWT